MARQDLDLVSLIEQTAKKHGVPPALLAALIQVESSNNPNAVSPKGAMGYGQLMPATAKSLGVKDAFDPTENVNGAAKLLGQLLKKYKDNPVMALAAYNAGEPAVDKAKGVPDIPETRNYIKKVIMAVGQFINPPAPPRQTATEIVRGVNGPLSTERTYSAPYPPEIAVDRGGRRAPMVSPVAIDLPSQEQTQISRAPMPAPQTAASTVGTVPGMGRISEKQMQAVMDMIAQENTGVPLDMSRQYTELQPGVYGEVAEPPSLARIMPTTSAGFYPGEGMAPSAFSAPRPGGMDWLSRYFKLTGQREGPSFTDFVGGER